MARRFKQQRGNLASGEDSDHSDQFLQELVTLVGPLTVAQ